MDAGKQIFKSNYSLPLATPLRPPSTQYSHALGAKVFCSLSIDVSPCYYRCNFDNCTVTHHMVRSISHLIRNCIHPPDVACLAEDVWQSLQDQRRHLYQAQANASQRRLATDGQTQTTLCSIFSFGRAARSLVSCRTAME